MSCTTKNIRKKILFDSNVLISAVLNPNGSPRKSLFKATTYCQAYICDQTVEELNLNFTTKLSKYLDRLMEFWRIFSEKFTVIPMPEDKIDLENKIRDETDRPILRAAISAAIDIIATGDRDFTESKIDHPMILTPSQFLILDL
ncbi:MAG: putative toxin-antitoxin system toxin component, PIN family [Selenomonadaceae bacterium]|nr:putative toxin-antitoxin system toxin component, PIN family [Selenomonadaceae bacterium]